jgi:hypothetical protein
MRITVPIFRGPFPSTSSGELKVEVEFLQNVRTYLPGYTSYICIYWSMVYLPTLLAARPITTASQGTRKISSEQRRRRNEGNGSAIIWGLTAAFVWRDWKKSQNPRSGLPCSRIDSAGMSITWHLSVVTRCSVSHAYNHTELELHPQDGQHCACCITPFRQTLLM